MNKVMSETTMVNQAMVMQALSVVLAFVLGLGPPRSFVLLYIICAVSLLMAWREESIAPTPVLLWSAITLLGFGISYVALRLSWGIWIPVMENIPAILGYATLPVLCLMTGWCLQRLGGSLLSRKVITLMILAYGLGGLFYVLISLGLTHSSWWDWLKPLKQSVVVPWGSESTMNMRSVEQRSYIILACLPTIFNLSPAHQLRHRLLALTLLFAALLASMTTWSFQSRIGAMVLLVSALPWICSFKMLHRRLRTICLLCVSFVCVVGTGLICDERFSLQTRFVANMWQEPWGGRRIRYDYGDCDPAITNHFGSFVGSNSSSPHNVLLDIYNDSGIVPFLLMLAALSIIVIKVFRWFFVMYSVGDWDCHMAVRWAMFSTIVVQFLSQPFMYSDQLMFSVGFMFCGAIMGEANEKARARLIKGER